MHIAVQFGVLLTSAWQGWVFLGRHLLRVSYVGCLSRRQKFWSYEDLEAREGKMQKVHSESLKDVLAKSSKPQKNGSQRILNSTIFLL